MMTETVTRHVVTHVDRRGMRTLSLPAQGYFTYETPAAAQAQIDAMIKNNAPDKLASIYGPHDFRLEVRPCECHAGHFDPVGVWFD